MFQGELDETVGSRVIRLEVLDAHQPERQSLQASDCSALGQPLAGAWRDQLLGEVTVGSQSDAAGCFLVGESELLMRPMKDGLNGSLERQGRDEGLHEGKALVESFRIATTIGRKGVERRRREVRLQYLSRLFRNPVEHGAVFAPIPQLS
jgi:hypothetical protein